MRQFEPSYRDILRIAAPISFSLMIPQVSFVANTLFVAHLGSDALSVIGMVGVYYLLLTWLGYGLSNGMLVLLSRSAGAHNIHTYGTTFRNGLVIGGIFTLILLLVSYLMGGAMYRSLLTHEALVSEATGFLHLRLLGFPFLIINQLINVFFISTGRTMWLLAGSLLGNLVNIFFDYVLIFGNMGFPEMGVNGAAIGSVLGELVYFLVMVVVILGHRWQKEYALIGGLGWDPVVIRKIIQISSPLVFQYIFSIGGWQVYFIYMEHLGREEVAATHILRNALGVIGIGGWALASTSNTLVSNLLGQNRKQDVLPGVKRILMVSVLFGLSCSLFLYTAKDLLMPYFSTDSIVVDRTMQGLGVIYGSSVLLCMATVLFNALIGLGATRISMIFEVSCVLLYVLYLTLVVQVFHLNFWWAWTSEYAYWGLLFVLSSIYILRKKWMTSTPASVPVS